MPRERVVRGGLGALLSGFLVASMALGGDLSAAAEESVPYGEELTVEDVRLEGESSPDEIEDEALLADLTEEASPEAVGEEESASSGEEAVEAIPMEQEPAAETVVASAATVGDELSGSSASPAPDSAGVDVGQAAVEPSLMDIEMGRAGAELAVSPLATPVPNPILVPQCGVSVAFVLDVSGSISPPDALLSRAAAQDVLEVLRGTPSEMGLYHFSTTATRHLPKTSVSTNAGADLVRSRIHSIPPPRGTTNWDHALQLVAEESYDVVLFVTDGIPSAIGPTGAGVPTQVAVEHAAIRADALKAGGTKIVGIGVGPGANVSTIQAISGKLPGDYYSLASYDALSEFLTDLASENCRGTVSVVKQVRDIDGELTAVPDWEFTATSSTDGAVITPPVGATDHTGAVNFDISHETLDEVTVSITETQQPGHALEQQDGFNAQCGTADGPLPVTNVGEHGFTLVIERGAIVSCSVINEEVPIPLDITIDTFASFDREYLWSLDKTVDHDMLTVLPGESGTFEFTVAAAPDGYIDTGFEMAGQTTIANPNAHGDQMVTVEYATDVGLVCAPDIEDADLDAPGHQVLVPEQVGDIPGTVSFPYSCDGTPTSYSGTVHVTADYVDIQDTRHRVTADADVDYKSEDERSRSITVYDDMADPTAESVELGMATWNEEGAPTEFVYTLELGNPDNQCLTYTNTAFYVEGQEAMAMGTLEGDEVPQPDSSAMDTSRVSVSIDVEACVDMPPTIQATALADLDRTYLWDIDKSVKDSKITTDSGGATFEYLVTATPLGNIDENHSFMGIVTLGNPMTFLDRSVTVDIDVDIAGLVCVIDAADIDDATDGLQVIVTRGDDDGAEMLAVDYTCEGVPEQDDGAVTVTMSYVDAGEELQVVTAVADVAYQPLDEVNRTVTVVDDLADPGADPVELGIAEWNSDGVPIEFAYTLQIDGDGDRCEVYTNMAVIVETGQSDSVDVELCAAPVLPAKPVAAGPVSHLPTSRPSLPSTGASGSAWFIVMGGTAVLAGGGVLLGSRRGRRE